MLLFEKEIQRNKMKAYFPAYGIKPSAPVNTTYIYKDAIKICLSFSIGKWRAHALMFVSWCLPLKFFIMCIHVFTLFCTPICPIPNTFLYLLSVFFHLRKYSPYINQQFLLYSNVAKHKHHRSLLLNNCLEISSLNVRGLANKNKREKVFTWIKIIP